MSRKIDNVLFDRISHNPIQAQFCMIGGFLIQNLTSILGSTSWYEVVGHIEITAVPYVVLAHISNEVKSHVFYISPQGSKIPCRIFAAHPPESQRV